MKQTTYKYLKIISFKEVSQWYVEHYMNESKIHSKYPLVPLRELIAPKKNVIKKEEYDGSFPIVEKIVFKTGKVVFRDKKVTGMNLYFLQQGDLLISNINFHQGATALNTFGEIAASTHYQPYSINLNKVDPEFLVMVLRSSYFLSIISGKKAQGIKNESGYNFIGSFSIPLPNLKKQRQIVALYKAKIKDAEDLTLKAEKTEQAINIYLLDMLGGNEANKDDGETCSSNYKYVYFIRYSRLSEWGIEQIQNKQRQRTFKYPIVKVKDLCQLGSGGTPSRTCSQYYSGTIPWIKTGEVINEEILDTEENITEDAIVNSSAKLYPKGSLIIAMYGQGETRGRTAKMGIDATTNQACAVLHNIDNNIVSTDYLWYYLQGRYHDLRSLACGNNQPNLNAGKIKNFDVVAPPMDVQNAIVAHIKQQKILVKQMRHKSQAKRTEALIEFENEIFE